MTNVAMADLKHLQGNSFRARVQRFGGNLAGMIMPNIGAFIAWGLITALFIPTGWLPNETLGALVGPMITYLLPILIGYTGGRMVHGQRGAVIGAIATMGVIVGTDVPMFLGAMIIGPLAALLIKYFDRTIEGKIRAGFEMLVNNFSVGILGGGMALLGTVVIGPVVEALTNAAGHAVDFLVDNTLLPLVSIIVEPAKVLFLNNAINHGVFGPLGVDQATQNGQSILFMIETNPGPGFGILLAFLLFGPRRIRATVPGAMIIQFLGGIHEIYFPYVLMKPMHDPGRDRRRHGGRDHRARHALGPAGHPGPGQHLRLPGGHPARRLHQRAAVHRGRGRGVVHRRRGADEVRPRRGCRGRRRRCRTPRCRAKKTRRMPRRMPSPRPAARRLARSANGAVAAPARPVISGKDVKSLVVACDAGMGSSVMLASQMRTRLKPYGVTVEHMSVNNIPADTRLVLTHADLAERARATVPHAVVVEFQMFLGDPVFDQVENAIKEGSEIRG